jgi:hypothetical protein
MHYYTKVFKIFVYEYDGISWSEDCIFLNQNKIRKANTIPLLYTYCAKTRENKR